MLQGNMYEQDFQLHYGQIGTRAYIIDALFGFCSNPSLEMIDKNIVYSSASILDRYYNELGKQYLLLKTVNPEANHDLGLIKNQDAKANMKLAAFTSLLI